MRMANQIATFFDSMPERDEALLELATHLKKFWEPRMRHALLSQIDTGTAQTLHPLVLQSIERHRALLT